MTPTATEYWDSSALVALLHAPTSSLLDRWGDASTSPVCHVHALLETFSALTGSRLTRRYAPDDAAAMIASAVESRLRVVSPEAAFALETLHGARKAGVRGGAVYDWQHVRTAEAEKAKVIITENLDDFRPLTKIPLFWPA